MNETHHITMRLDKAIEFVLKFQRKNQQQNMFSSKNGNYINNAKCLKEFQDYKRKNYKYVPVCDNVNTEGMCQGHEIKSNA